MDNEAIKAITNSKEKVESLLEQYKFREALFEVIDLARTGNQYMQKKEPWILAKQLDENGKIKVDAQRLIDNCLHICLQMTANLAILINPFLPFTSKKICHLLKVVDKMLEWENAGKLKLLSVGYSLRPPELLFRKIEDTEVTYQIEKLHKALEASKENSEEEKVAPISLIPVKPEIVFDDFAKIDLRVGKILSAEKVEKADKLLKLEVLLGFETRTIVSGIALHFKPEEIVGKQVTVVVNLAPRKMRGIESNGMILMAEDASGRLHFINPEDSIGEGATVN
jgi:methionyl-tRNA synthetase